MIKKESLEKYNNLENNNFSNGSFCNKNNQTIINNDFLKYNDIPNDFVDLIITSPPYNLDIDYNSYNDKLSYYDYLEFSKN